MSRLKDRRFGIKIAKNEDDKNEVKETYSPDEPDQILRILRNQEIDLTGSLKLNKKVPDSNAIVFDRTALGNMFDNSNKQFDVGYDSSQETNLETINF